MAGSRQCPILPRLQAHHLLDRDLVATQQALSRLCMRDPACDRTETVILRCLFFFSHASYTYIFRLLFGISNCIVLQSLCFVVNLRANTYLHTYILYISMPFLVWSKSGTWTVLPDAGKFMLVKIFVDLSYVI